MLPKTKKVCVDNEQMNYIYKFKKISTDSIKCSQIEKNYIVNIQNNRQMKLQYIELNTCSIINRYDKLKAYILYEKKRDENIK